MRTIHSKEAGAAWKFLGVASNASAREERAEERSPGVRRCSPALLSKWWNHNVVMKKLHSGVLSGAARVIRED